ncbi:MAG: VWA domain-containing protein [Proteobacteria bacterium]|nr:VWA domain-containing protein [Pseudomonadota bacterium]MBQ9242263.1 VWA domain-containing protein [Pseudomonadota bacterium]
MGIYDSILMKAVARRTLTIYFLIDVSWSMRGYKIDAVNQALAETIPMIQEVSEENADAEIMIAILTYGTFAEWIQEPTSVIGFDCPTITTGGQTNFKDACIKLKEMLMQQDSKTSGAGCYAPVFILMADGGSNAYKTVLKDLRQIKWFKHGIKAAIAIGDDVHFNVLAEFTGDADTVFRAHSAKRLKDLIKLISVKSSQIASKSASVQGHAGYSNAKNSSSKSASFQQQSYRTTASASSMQKAAQQELEIDRVYSKQEELAKTLKMFTPAEDEDSPENWDW